VCVSGLLLFERFHLLCHSDVTWAAGCAGLPEFLCVWVCGWVVVATDLAAGAAFCLSPIEGPKAR